MRHVYLLLFFFASLCEKKEVSDMERIRFSQGLVEVYDMYSSLIADITKQNMEIFTLYEGSMLALVICLLFIATRKKEMNNSLSKEVQALKIRITEDAEIVGGLSSYLEERRSRNSGFESPLRRIKRGIETISQGINKDAAILEKVVMGFQSFKLQYLEQSSQVTLLSQENIDELRIKAELAMLRKFIIGEVQAIQNVSKYYKSLVDEAEDDIDRVLISEGI